MKKIENQIHRILELLDSKDRAPKSEIRPILYEMLSEIETEEQSSILKEIREIKQKLNEFE